MIHIDFATFDEMVAFARQLAGMAGAPQAAVEAAPARQQTPPQQAQPAKPAAPTGPASPQPPAAAHAEAPVTAPAAPPATPPATPVASAAIPTNTRAYTRDELAMAAIPIMDAGGQQALMDLLHTFGVNALTELPEANYGAFATALRGMGAKI